MTTPDEHQTIIDMFMLFEPMDGVHLLSHGKDFIVEVICDTQPVQLTKAYVQADQLKGDTRQKAEFLANTAATLHSTMVALRALHDDPGAFVQNG